MKKGFSLLQARDESDWYRRRGEGINRIKNFLCAGTGSDIWAKAASGAMSAITLEGTQNGGV